MSQELRISGSFRYTKGDVDIQKSFPTDYVDVAGGNPIENVQAVGTSYEAMLFGDVGTPGWLFIRNIDDTNYVSLSVDGVTEFARLNPGEPWMSLRLGPGVTTPQLKANTLACKVEYKLFPN